MGNMRAGYSLPSIYYGLLVEPIKELLVELILVTWNVVAFQLEGGPLVWIQNRMAQLTLHII